MNELLSEPLRARPCRCPEPVGDLREGTCVWCGHQAEGRPIPTTKVAGISRNPLPPMVLTGRRNQRPR